MQQAILFVSDNARIITVTASPFMQERNDTFATILSRTLRDGVIDLRAETFLTPRDIAAIILKCRELQRAGTGRLILPSADSTRSYLRRMHLHEIFREIGFASAAQELDKYAGPELNNPRVHEIVRCSVSDEFRGRQPRLLRMLEAFGLERDVARAAGQLLIELGNNCFDHNYWRWPDPRLPGCFILGQAYPSMNRINLVVADTGVGFMESIRPAKPDVMSQIDAVTLGLSGITGRVREKRGKGLLFVQKHLPTFEGRLRIQSYDGLVVVGGPARQSFLVSSVLGTIAELELFYKGEVVW